MDIAIKESKAEMEYRKMTEGYVPKKNEYQDKLDRLRKTLLFECLYNLFDRSIVYKYNNQVNENIKKNLIENFITEQGGTEDTIKSFKKSKNFLLCEYYRIINTYSDLMLESGKDKKRRFGYSKQNAEKINKAYKYSDRFKFGFLIKNFKEIFKNINENPRKTGNFEIIRPRLQTIIDNCTKPGDIEFLLRDLEAAVPTMDDIIEKNENKNPQVVAGAKKHKQWLQTVYKKKLNDKLKELKKKENVKESYYEDDNLEIYTESKRKKACKEEDDTSIEIDMDSKDDFFDEIEKSDDIDYVSNIIQNRVSRSIDEFIRDNTMDKFKIQDIIQTTQDNINNYNTDDSNEEDIKESFEALAKQKLNDITEGNRPKTIFECMVYNIANSSYKDEKLKKIYTENDSLNVDSIVENTKIIYTFLEMLNTTNMVKINESYIQKVLNDLNK